MSTILPTSLILSLLPIFSSCSFVIAIIVTPDSLQFQFPEICQSVFGFSYYALFCLLTHLEFLLLPLEPVMCSVLGTELGGNSASVFLLLGIILISRAALVSRNSFFLLLLVAVFEFLYCHFLYLPIYMGFVTLPLWQVFLHLFQLKSTAIVLESASPAHTLWRTWAICNVLNKSL